MQDTVVIDGELDLLIPIDGYIDLVLADDGEMENVIKVVERDAPVYTGETTITPTTSGQVLSTQGTILLDDITIEPIPQTYGLITWNGSVLTVS